MNRAQPSQRIRIHVVLLTVVGLAGLVFLLQWWIGRQPSADVRALAEAQGYSVDSAEAWSYNKANSTSIKDTAGCTKVTYTDKDGWKREMLCVIENGKLKVLEDQRVLLQSVPPGLLLQSEPLRPSEDGTRKSDPTQTPGQ